MKLQIPVREVIFGLEDSLVSTLGVVIGIATGTQNRQLVILSAVVVIVVESLSMTAGTYLSNKSEMEVAHKSASASTHKSLYNSLFMGVFYVLGGLISVTPFLFLSVHSAIIPSVILSFIVLFIIGYVKGSVAGINKIKSGLEMSLVSLAAASVGYLIGRISSPFLQK